MTHVLSSEDEEVEITVEVARYHIKIVPMDDVILEVVWSDVHRRLVCIARISPKK